MNQFQFLNAIPADVRTFGEKPRMSLPPDLPNRPRPEFDFRSAMAGGRGARVFTVNLPGRSGLLGGLVVAASLILGLFIALFAGVIGILVSVAFWAGRSLLRLFGIGGQRAAAAPAGSGGPYQQSRGHGHDHASPHVGADGIIDVEASVVPPVSAEHERVP